MDVKAAVKKESVGRKKMRCLTGLLVTLFVGSGFVVHLYAEDQKTNAVVDLSGEWTFSTGYVFGQMSLVQSSNHVSGTYSYTTDNLQHGKCKIGGEIHYPKVILFFDCGGEFDRTNVFSVVLWKDGKRSYLKSEDRAYSPDFLRPGMK
jgi:hypothetical protein